VRSPGITGTVNQEQRMDESQAIGAAIAGDREAFGHLVRLHQARLRALAALSLTDREAVLDVVQESFVDAWRALDRFDRSREFGPWLRTICRNRVLKHLRDRLPRRRRELALVDEALIAAPPAEDAAPEGRLSTLRRCLENLDDHHRKLLERRYHDGATVQDLAQALGKSPNAVSMILLRLKAVLQRCMIEATS
jgi:RNA polymerase sigma-70 factor (ECF subfamily)